MTISGKHTYLVENMVALKAVINVSLYVALGDSITAGYGVDSPFSFPNVYGTYFRRHDKDLKVLNLGINGLTTSGLLNLMKSNRNFRYYVSQASLITLTIGSNDLLRLIGRSQQKINSSQIPLIYANMTKTLELLGHEIRVLSPNATVKVATLYCPLTPWGPYAQYYSLAQGMIDNSNAIIVAWAKRYGFIVVYIDQEFKGKERLLTGQDQAHPNATGYQVIARAFARY